MGVNSLPKTVTRQRHDCDLNPGPSAPECSTLTTRLPSHLSVGPTILACMALSSSPENCAKNGKLRRELLQKCAVIQENCAKIVSEFNRARLIKNDHDE